MDNLEFVSLLFGMSVVGMWFAARYAAEAQTWLNFRSLVMVNYIMVQPLSGAVHLMRLGGTRGFFDLTNFEGHAGTATLSALIGLIALLIGFGRKMQQTDTPNVHPNLTRVERRVVVTLTLMLGPAALFGLVQMQSIAGSLDTSRIISLTGGTARYSYLANWTTFITTLAVMYLIGRRNMSSGLTNAFIVAVGLAVIVFSQLWSGGRSIILVMCLPLVLYSLPKLYRTRTPLLLIASATFLVGVLAITEMRDADTYAGRADNMFDWIDWQWGRFSIIGTSIEYVSVQGYLFGETFLASLNFTLAPLFAALGIPPVPLKTSYDISSRVLFGDYSALYVVPGFTAELFVNFGLVGIFIGHLILGRAVRLIDLKIRRTQYALTLVLLYYIGSLLLFRTMTADSASFPIFLLYNGAPLILAAVAARVFRGRHRQIDLSNEAPDPLHGRVRRINRPA